MDGRIKLEMDTQNQKLHVWYTLGWGGGAFQSPDILCWFPIWSYKSMSNPYTRFPAVLGKDWRSAVDKSMLTSH